MRMRNNKMIMGLDLSLVETGVCILSGDKIILSDVIKPKIKGIERLMFIEEKVCFILREDDFIGCIDLVCVEGYSFGSRAGQAFSIGELGGVIKKFLFENHYKSLIVAPTSLKKFITGKGNSKKDVVMMKTLQKYGVEFVNNNKCDAFCLAKMGHAYLNGTDIAYEKEALKKVELLK